jgi:uncharacterized membrane protein
MVSLERIMYYVLIVGMLSSGALYVIGIILFAAQNPGASTPLPNFNEATFMTDLVNLHPVAFLTLGTVVLIATPITRVFVSIVVFSINRERRFVLVTAIVFTVLMLSLLLGYLFHFSPSG